MNSNLKYATPIGIGIAAILNLSVSFGQDSAGDWSPTGPAPVLDVYYPGTEALDPDEIRITACGTGQPTARPKQAAACWLIELGNGDKFLFDIGAGSHENISAYKIPYDYLDKVFIGHLHVDHFGDFASFWLGGTTMNRLTPVRVWGPSGAESRFGTKYAMEKMQELYQWDIATRAGFIDDRGMELEVTEFDYRGEGEVIFDENGVIIRSIPAIHALDGAVSFILEWNDLKVAYSSDTFPNRWWLEYAKGSDIAIHECFLSPRLLVEKQGFTPAEALNVGSIAHTSPSQFGKVMSLTEPRMAVGYHFFNDFDTFPEMYTDVRKTYGGPLVLALDNMVFNVNKNDIRVRMAVLDEEAWPSPPTIEKLPPRGGGIPMSDFIQSGAEMFPEVLGPVWDEINEIYGTDYEPAL